MQITSREIYQQRNNINKEFIDKEKYTLTKTLGYFIPTTSGEKKIKDNTKYQ